MKKRYQLFVAVVLLLVFWGCSEEKEDGPEAAKGNVVCTSGYYYDLSMKKNFCYWVNGSMQKVSFPDDIFNSESSSVTISNGKVYAAGTYLPPNRRHIACYFEDGVRRDLEGVDKSGISYSNAIAVADEKIYVAGGCKDASLISSMACYWINGELQLLPVPEGSVNSVCVSIAVSGDKICIGGYYKATDGRLCACYWVNGERTDLLVPEQMSAECSSVVISDGKIYAAGSYFGGFNRAACYWVDGVRTDISKLEIERSFSVYATAIAVLGGKVYVAGCEYTCERRAYLWIDGAKQVFAVPEGSIESYCSSLTVSEGKIYAVGFYAKSVYEYIPCYWVDGARIDLQTPEETFGECKSIAVNVK